MSKFDKRCIYETLVYNLFDFFFKNQGGYSTSSIQYGSFCYNLLTVLT